MSFETMGLSAQIYQALKKMGFEKPTPIQTEAIPIALQGKDIIGQAQTGTGKTAAFAIPAIEHCMKKGDAKRANSVAHPHVLVMAPTRELAVQISMEIDRMSEFANVRTVCVYGGQEIEKQFRAFMQKVDIVVGTPGRLLDHIERKSLDLSDVDFVVLDEADRMLDMGFIHDIVDILEKTNPKRQTMLFSATMQRQIENIAHDYMNQPHKIAVSADQLTIDKVSQKFLIVDAKKRLEYLFAVLQSQNPQLAVIFVRTKASADKLSTILSDRGIEADCLHGDMRQGARDRVIKKFKQGHLKVLVATDLAARGLDVFNVTHVINYDLPMEFETYVHRIGRTARMGAEGVAITFAFEDQEGWLRDLVRMTRVPLEELLVTLTGLPPRIRRAPSRSDDNGQRSRGGRFGEDRRRSNQRYGDNNRSSERSNSSSGSRRFQRRGSSTRKNTGYTGRMR